MRFVQSSISELISGYRTQILHVIFHGALLVERLQRPLLRSSISGSLAEANGERSDSDLDVQPQAPIIDVPQIMLHALLHLLERAGFSAITINLGPAGDAGLDVVAEGVVADDLLIFGVVGGRVRAGAYQRHVTLEHVEELRQLVDRGLAQPFAGRRHARVVL